MNSDAPRPSPRAIASLLVLSCIVGLNTVDRNMLGLLLPQIQREIHISDLMLGVLMGPAFMIVYSMCSLPIAWLADRTSRRGIIVCGLTFWSLVTAATGFAQNLAQLLAARIGLGMGEASNMAPASALIGDTFGGRYRVLAMAVFAAGGPVAIMICYPIIGRITAEQGWRAAYAFMGLAGLGVATLTLLIVRESQVAPAHGKAGTPAATQAASGIWRATRQVAGTPGFALLCLASVMVSVNFGAMLAWLPSFMVRLRGLDTATTGALLGTYKGLVGVAGSIAGGLIVTGLMRFDQRWLAWAPMLFCFGIIPAELLLLFADAPNWWHIGLAADTLLMSAITPCLFALLLSLLDSGLRATGVALYLLIFNLVGQSIGPLAVGMINDRLSAAWGTAALRSSLLIAPLSAAAGAALLLALAARLEESQAAPG